jgi:phosphate starvation-inducible PhoH-like protein
MPIGLLPGTLEEKMQPYVDAIEFTIQKILDESGNMGSQEILSSLLRNDIIREEPISFLRGKTFDNSIIIVDEAENLNKQETLLILSRIGRNSKMVFLGDNQQIDRKDIKKSKEKCGLDYAFDVLKDIDEIGFLEFTEEDIIRNPIITKIIKKWNNIEE